LERDPAKKEEIRKELAKTHCAVFLRKVNTIQHENGGLYLVGKELTWADIFIAAFLDKLERTIDSNLLRGWPHVRKMKESVENQLKIKEWLAKRPKET